MKRDEIERSLTEKYDDKYTIKIFSDFVLEFQECFSDIMPAEEVIERIKKNIFSNVVVKEELNHFGLDAMYNAKTRTVELKKEFIDNEEYMKYILFHEMLHAITVVRDENSEIINSGFSNRNSNGPGLDEAMTEYLSQIRNKKCVPNVEGLISGYRVIVNEMERLSLIVGKKELIQSYFYNPQNIEEVLKSRGLDYAEISSAFSKLMGKDDDVLRIKNGYSLCKNENYSLHRAAEAIFYNYSNAIGEVKNLKDFARKYGLFMVSENPDYDSIKTMELSYYKNMGDDVQRLIKSGIPYTQIKEIIGKMKIDFNALNCVYDISKCFSKDKNKTAINLYEYYMKNPRTYFAFFAHNYGKLLDCFHEYDCQPNETALYTSLSYPIIGALLKEHPTLDFSDISFNQIEEEYSKINVFVFWGSDNKKYAYDTTGKAIEIIVDDKGNEKLEIPVNEQCKFRFIYNKDGHVNYEYSAQSGFDMENFMKNVHVSFKEQLSEKSDFEYWISQGWDEDGYIRKLLDKIVQRMQKREVSSNIDF